MPKDRYEHCAESPLTPAELCFAIEPSDNVELPYVTKSIYIGRSGDIMLVPASADEPVLFRNVVAGTTLDIRVRAVRQSGTTAVDLVGLA